VYKRQDLNIAEEVAKYDWNFDSKRKVVYRSLKRNRSKTTEQLKQYILKLKGLNIPDKVNVIFEDGNRFDFRWNNLIIKGSKHLNSGKNKTSLVTAKGIIIDVDRCLYDELKKYSWYIDHAGYPATSAYHVNCVMRPDLSKDSPVRLHQYVWHLTGNQKPNYDLDYSIDHINRNKLDNRASNLRLASQALQLSNRKILRGSEIGTSKLTEELVLKIKQNYKAQKYTRAELASMFNVSLYSIDSIIYEQSWKHV
jgi:hypothetical protein